MPLQGGGQTLREQLIRCRKTRHQPHQPSIDSEMPVRMVVEVPLAGLSFGAAAWALGCWIKKNVLAAWARDRLAERLEREDDATVLAELRKALGGENVQPARGEPGR